jgi:hypothetical protein
MLGEQRGQMRLVVLHEADRLLPGLA